MALAEGKRGLRLCGFPPGADGLDFRVRGGAPQVERSGASGGQVLGRARDDRIEVVHAAAGLQLDGDTEEAILGHAWAPDPDGSPGCIKPWSGTRSCQIEARGIFVAIDII